MSHWSNASPTITKTVSNDPPHRTHQADIDTVDQQGTSLSPKPRTDCLLYQLPTEMRLDIYELALLDAQPTVSGLPFLQTCRHISMEARPTLYKRPTSFSSQAKLFEWIDRSRRQDLRRVRTLKLRLTDIDLSSLLDQSTPTRTTRASVWTLYQSELGRFDDALKALPNLSSLTIVPPESGRSQLLKGLYHSFLGLVTKRCPKLGRLELQDSDDILDAVPALKDVYGVICTGGSSSSSQPTEDKAKRSPPVKSDIIEQTIEVDEMHESGKGDDHDVPVKPEAVPTADAESSGSPVRRLGRIEMRRKGKGKGKQARVVESE